MAANLGTLLNNESHPPRERLRLLNQVVSDTLREAFSSNDMAETVTTTQELATHVVDIGLRSEVAIRDVAMIANHDFCTFTHSANVACYGTLLAHAMGIRNTDELCEIAAGGMLHDLGKLGIPNRILCKAGRLTKEEMATMRLHPTRGFQLLRREQGISRGQLLMAYQHHEWMNGAGYPVGCMGNDLHLWAKICAVVDVFEALTGKRPVSPAEFDQRITGHHGPRIRDTLRRGNPAVLEKQLCGECQGMKAVTQRVVVPDHLKRLPDGAVLPTTNEDCATLRASSQQLNSAA